jgi:hypothetical protein
VQGLNRKNGGPANSQAKEVDMERYRNLGGASNVVAFEIGQGSITVQFMDDSVYLYTSQSAGATNIAEMHRLARAGRGLNRFISHFVKKGYAKKLG